MDHEVAAAAQTVADCYAPVLLDCRIPVVHSGMSVEDPKAEDQAAAGEAQIQVVRSQAAAAAATVVVVEPGLLHSCHVSGVGGAGADVSVQRTFDSAVATAACSSRQRKSG